MTQYNIDKLKIDAFKLGTIMVADIDVRINLQLPLGIRITPTEGVNLPDKYVKYLYYTEKEWIIDRDKYKIKEIGRIPLKSMIDIYLCPKCNIVKDYGSMAELMPDPICVECHLLTTGEYFKCPSCKQSIKISSNFHCCIPLTQHAIDHPLKEYQI